MKGRKRFTNRLLSGLLSIVLVVTGMTVPNTAVRVQAEESNQIKLEIGQNVHVDDVNRNAANLVDGSDRNHWDSDYGENADMP